MNHHDQQLSALRAPERIIMHRFTLLAGIALLSIPANSAPEPPSISVCYGGVCLVRLHWSPPPGYNSGGLRLPSIAGTLINRSDNTLSLVSLEFTLQSERSLVDTASASFPGRIPPGASWEFNAYFVDWDGKRLVTRSDSGVMRGVVTTSSSRRFEQTLTFDPVFNPVMGKERQDWEKIHGKRDQ